THRRTFAVETNRATVIDLLALDRMNPRALLFQLDVVSERLKEVWPRDENAPMGELERALIRLHTSVAVALPEELDSAALRQVTADIADLSGRIAQSYLR
ncbi:alpha-E domain-containing protein, partial [Bradyrhizobium sp. NBAIM08]|uniref:alpha-E domain-containing protein n=1 Tax=Bradyrhizobium sp. NBAIM08 TaxID=2793815 RepID=UPI001CD2977E